MDIRHAGSVGRLHRPLPFRLAQLRSFARLLERLTLAAVPAVGVAACNPNSLPPDLGTMVVEDLAAPACPLLTESCLWLIAANGVELTDASYSWPADGPDPCAPCGFGSRPGVRCGTCSLASTNCGITYVCSIAECSDSCASVGRRPAGLVLPSLRAAGEGVGEWLARVAHLEAASVPAFAQLVRELEAHQAPARLIKAASAALRDEERHARVMSMLARDAGASVPAVEIASMETRPLAEIVHENAIEGCVRESLGALVAAEQACLVEDAVLGNVLARIAVDETRHANLAWAVDAWASPLLSADARQRIARARATEARALLSALKSGCP